ncbi:MAG TPA: MFS transporter [Acetobacteraceae bacterium]|jgi:MFS family permease|nr:MFS transporter [Acetobacteraceae bacterium]
MLKRQEIDSPYAWFRLGVSILLSAIGGVGMWSVVVVLPTVGAEFHAERGAASLPFTLTMIGFGIGGVIMGRVADKRGIVLPVMIGAVTLGVGYMLASFTTGLWSFAAAYMLIGTFGAAATFVPLIADISFWFEKRRGIAVALCASGNYVSGAFWPTLIEWAIRTHGWRTTHFAIGAFCLLVMPPLTLLLRSRPPQRAAGAAIPAASRRQIALSPAALQTLLAVAGLACCVAMSMPQVHIVAYCADLGYGPARGAQMLSLMLGFGIVSRVGSGFLADRLGGVATLLIGSAAQMTALTLYLLMDGLTSLYIISALFGLFQGGLVPSYAIIIRECFPAREAGARVGVVMMMTLLGMALGGWMSGVIFDYTGSYRAAFANGIAWNALNFAIALFFLSRSRISALRLATAPHAGSAAE